MWIHAFKNISLRSKYRYAFQDIHWVLQAWMDCLKIYSILSLVSAYLILIMFQDQKFGCLSFNKMCLNVTPMTKWQKKDVLLSIRIGSKMTIS